MICIAGMPRSGTSLVTQLLHRAGVHLGPAAQLMPPSVNNPDGFWENLRFVRLNERLLAASGATWYAPPAQLRPTGALIAEAKSILRQFEAKEPWAWKDPRNAVTLPFWKSLLPAMNVLVCIRHPAETASSLIASTLVPRTVSWAAARPGTPLRLQDAPASLAGRIGGVIRTALPTQTRRNFIREVALELWRISNETILRETAAGERLVVHYDAVLKNPRAELLRILAFAGLTVADEALDEITTVVKPRMRHERAGAADLPRDVAALYARLSREASDAS